MVLSPVAMITAWASRARHGRREQGMDVACVDLQPPERGVTGTTTVVGFAGEEHNGHGDAVKAAQPPRLLPRRGGRRMLGLHVEVARPSDRGDSSMRAWGKK